MSESSLFGIPRREEWKVRPENRQESPSEEARRNLELLDMVEQEYWEEQEAASRMNADDAGFSEAKDSHDEWQGLEWNPDIVF